ncbi:MAG TPA: DUF4232 domain-containing protein [Pseudonocardiaceae bacterium]|jgi:hypothetical protein|nr:DUF4232 domain-containing protein [Pseudonocardiaceae bacterium]
MDIKNIGRNNTVRALLVGTGVLAAVAVAGCAGGPSATGQNSAGAGSQTVATSTNPGTTSSDANNSGATSNDSTSTGTGSTATVAVDPADLGSSATGNTANTLAASARAGIPECKANHLALSFGGGDAGMSQQERVLRFTNTGTQTCAIVGFPGVSYVAGDNGVQVGAPAVRTGSIGAQVNLRPGQVASTVIHSVDPGVFDPSTCKPTPVRGYRIYAPDDTASMFIPLDSGAQGCAGTTPDPQLSVVTIKAGLGNPDQP